MPAPRKQTISLSDTPYYHCVSRCVRRAFLCGDDKQTGKSYEHRRSWVEERLMYLAQVFAVEVCAYAVMSNHTHVILHVNQDKALNWSDQEVIERWHRLHKGTMITQQFMRDGGVPEYLRPLLEATVEQYRMRLLDISWFMRELNEPIARRANQEDGCTGRFWEGRFKSQALLDEAALMACMAYVDLNPVRASMADTPESSDYTSIKQRVRTAQHGKQPTYLRPFVGNPRAEQPDGLPFRLDDYLALVDMTGRALNPKKRGAIDRSQLPILERINLSPDMWLNITNAFEQHTCSVVGADNVMQDYCRQNQRRKLRGIASVA